MPRTPFFHRTSYELPFNPTQQKMTKRMLWYVPFISSIEMVLVQLLHIGLLLQLALLSYIYLARTVQPSSGLNLCFHAN